MRVLVVDDDFMVAKVHSGYVGRIEGCTVVGVAHTGADAVEQARELRPDLVLLDVYLPDMSGIDVLRALRTGAPDDPSVLVITAADDAATVAAALHGGALHYLVKPFDSRALAEQVERARRLRGRLAGLDRAGQEDIDRLFGAGSTRLPKGLTGETAALVERVLREHGGDLSATECAEQTRLSRVSARRYLEHFVDTGAARVHLRYGGTGRPERRYTWAR
ncbi:response regulator [Pseudonocardia sp. WMMC193]|uniref:response regulator n=1 Tax=Pseudonocardia sp. WMMC193 TaxID=2911965 RepID=UPI001EFF8DFF|nr:response regulator [Pseudonocardia sp. WMMC193]MCF7553412.1 response regulator [Pseudonocardia sp. WMMC193]